MFDDPQIVKRIRFWTTMLLLIVGGIIVYVVFQNKVIEDLLNGDALIDASNVTIIGSYMVFSAIVITVLANTIAKTDTHTDEDIIGDKEYNEKLNSGIKDLVYVRDYVEHHNDIEEDVAKKESLEDVIFKTQDKMLKTNNVEKEKMYAEEIERLKNGTKKVRYKFQRISRHDFYNYVSYTKTMRKRKVQFHEKSDLLQYFTTGVLATITQIFLSGGLIVSLLISDIDLTDIAFWVFVVGYSINLFRSYATKYFRKRRSYRKELKGIYTNKNNHLIKCYEFNEIEVPIKKEPTKIE